VGELEQERTASTKKNCRLSMDPPGQRGRAEYPFDLSRGMRLNLSKLSVEVLAANYVAPQETSPRTQDDRSLRQIALVIRGAIKMAKVTVGVEVIADPLLQLLYVRKAPIRLALPNDLAIVGDHKDAAGPGLQ
jgi:hypothetical protein